MAHFVRTHIDEVWVLGYAPTGADLIDLDEKTFRSVNGDGGGTWTPAANLGIAGAGFVSAGPWNVSGGSANITGPITFAKATNDDYFKFDAGHPETTPTALQSLIEVYSEFPEQSRANINSPISNAVQPLYAGIQALKTGTRFYSPLRVRNSGRITQIIFEWRVRDIHGAVPATLPRFGAFAIDISGTIFPFRAKDATTDDQGLQFLPMPANVGAYNTSTNFTYVCNQNQIIDKSKYAYFVGFVEESGSGSWVTNGNTLVSTLASFDQVTLLDGRS